MRQEFLMISGVTKADRHQVTANVSDAVSASGGWVVNHTMFSNIAITIQFSLPPRRLDELRDRIVAVNVKLDEDSLTKIQVMCRKQLPEAAEVMATLNITFIHDEPDLRREIPAVPG